MKNKTKLWLSDMAVCVGLLLLRTVLCVAMMFTVLVNSLPLCFAVGLVVDLVFAALLSKLERKAEQNGLLFREYFLRCALPAAVLPLVIAALLFAEWLGSLSGMHYNFDLFIAIFIAVSTVSILALFAVINRLAAGKEGR